MKKINILGTEYTVNIVEEHKKIDNIRLGFTDFSTKEIIVGKLSYDEENSIENLEYFQNKILRHEIVHAFLYESGLNENTDWAENEEIVDWIAIQFPKLNKLFKELKILDD